MLPVSMASIRGNAVFREMSRCYSVAVLRAVIHLHVYKCTISFQVHKMHQWMG